ncbi:Hypothetical protein R9X50_00588400 [Acrodontium crateriforme]|uniref:Uncharacterized protein n=1 Tax=Acrodontium crateriforme TaxID=150365 RepID=A0AAQ3M824_9PEZI|nr:Hypothetical protein R9X50_00588400 [Acrodontium crateriforme]
MAWIASVLAPIGNFLQHALMAYVGRKSRQAEHSTRQYLEFVTPLSSLEDLSDILKRVINIDNAIDGVFERFATRDDVPVWREENFTRYFEDKFGEHPRLSGSVGLLWRVLLSAAYFPFSPRRLGDEIQDNPGVGHDAFVRAHALLALRGFELLGNTKDGDALIWNRAKDKSYSEKTPRLARIIHGCLKGQSAPDDNQVQDVKDTLGLIQPVTWRSHPFAESAITENDFEATARRLLYGPSGEKTAHETSDSCSKTQLRNLVELLLLVQLDNKISRKGVCKDLYIRSTSRGAVVHTKKRPGDEFLTTYERTGDTRVATLTLLDSEVMLATKTASAFVDSFFGTNDLISSEEFQMFCEKSSAFLFLFFHLWAAIFEPIPMLEESDETLPTSIVNTLCLLNIAEFRTFTQGRHYRWHDNEVQLLHDLQSSKRVSNLIPDEKLSSTEFCRAMNLDKSNIFQVLLISCHDLSSGEMVEEGAKRVVVVFLSPPASPGKSMEMWRERNGNRDVQYLWQANMINLQPAIAVGAKGKGMFMVPELSTNRLEFRAQETVSGRPVPSVTVDLVARSVDVLGLVNDSQGWTMRLDELKCYRLPGEGVEITYSSNSPYA